MLPALPFASLLIAFFPQLISANFFFFFFYQLLFPTTVQTERSSVPPNLCVHLISYVTERLLFVFCFFLGCLVVEFTWFRRLGAVRHRGKPVHLCTFACLKKNKNKNKLSLLLESCKSCILFAFMLTQAFDCDYKTPLWTQFNKMSIPFFVFCLFSRPSCALIHASV